MPSSSKLKKTNPKHQCGTCRKAFSTSSHLRRHEVIHSGDRSCACPACHREFLRPDALRRHFVNCKEKRWDAQLPDPQPGRKPRSCDNCRSRKAKCDGGFPCKRCKLNRAECLYAPNTVHSTPTGETELSVPCGATPFLLSYTDPSNEATTDNFSALNAHAEGTPDQHEPLSDHKPAGKVDGFMYGLFSDAPVTRHSPPKEFKTGNPSRSRTFALTNRMNDLVSRLSSQHNANAKKQATSSNHFSIDVALTVFTAENLTKYVSAYFTYVHPHFPLLHRPTFDTQRASLPLVLALFLSGSFQCIPEDDALSARRFFDLAEDYVFQLLHELFILGKDLTPEALEITQAALLMVSLQTCFNDPKTRHRIRTKRHPSLVNAIRTLELADTSHQEPLNKADWGAFIAQELKIRLVTWVFTLDCMNAVLFNSTPQMATAMMTADLPCSTALFEAPTAADFDKKRSSSNHTPALRSIKDWISTLQDEIWPGLDAQDFCFIEPKQLLIVLFAIHSVIFVSRTTVLSPPLYRSLVRATDRWAEIWAVVRVRHQYSHAHFVGLTKYGQELCWLAQRILELAKADDQSCQYMKAVPTNSLKDLHDFLITHAE